MSWPQTVLFFTAYFLLGAACTAFGCWTGYRQARRMHDLHCFPPKRLYEPYRTDPSIHRRPRPAGSAGDV